MQLGIFWYFLSGLIWVQLGVRVKNNWTLYFFWVDLFLKKSLVKYEQLLIYIMDIAIATSSRRYMALQGGPRTNRYKWGEMGRKYMAFTWSEISPLYADVSSPYLCNRLKGANFVVLTQRSQFQAVGCAADTQHVRTCFAVSNYGRMEIRC